MKTKFNKYAALFFTLCTVLLVLSGCSEIFEPLPQLAKGTGIVRLSINNSDGRTIMPDYTVEDFILMATVIDSNDVSRTPIVFEVGGQPATSVDVTNEGDLFLSSGQYDIEIRAFLGSIETNPAAYGERLNVEVYLGKTTPAVINLAPLETEDGVGTFSWDLTFDPAIVSATMEIDRVVDGNPAGNPGFAETLVITDNRNEGEHNLGSGQHLVIFTLTNAEGKTVVWEEALHIYDNMTSHFEFPFENLFESVSLEQYIKSAIVSGNMAGIVEVHYNDILDIHFAGQNLSVLNGALVALYNETSNSANPAYNPTFMEDYTLANMVDIILVRAASFVIMYEDDDALKTAIRASAQNHTTITNIVITPAGDEPGDENSVAITICGIVITKTGFTFNDNVLQSIAITTQPTKVNYIIDEPLDVTGMVVTATYKDSTNAETTRTDIDWIINEADYHLDVANDAHQIEVHFGSVAPAILTVKVERHGALGRDDFGVNGNLSQNMRDTITALTVDPLEATHESPKIGQVTVYYLEKGEEFEDAEKATYGLPTAYGEYDVWFEVAQGTHYKATPAAIKTDAEFEILPVGLVASDFTFTEIGLNNQITVADAAAFQNSALGIAWKADTAWNNHKAVALTVLFRAHNGTETSAMPTALGYYDVVVDVAANTGYFDTQKVILFDFEVVTTPIATAPIEIGFINPDFGTDPTLTVGATTVSRTGVGGVPKDIEITLAGVDTYDGVEWRLNNTILTRSASGTVGTDVIMNDTTHVDTYTFKSAGKDLGGPYDVTVRVTIDGKTYSRTVEITVAP